MPTCGFLCLPPLEDRNAPRVREEGDLPSLSSPRTPSTPAGGMVPKTCVSLSVFSVLQFEDFLLASQFTDLVHSPICCSAHLPNSHLGLSIRCTLQISALLLKFSLFSFRFSSRLMYESDNPQHLGLPLVCFSSHLFVCLFCLSFNYLTLPPGTCYNFSWKLECCA